ncbi:MAG: hypothetical protein ACXIVF_19205 [Rhizobiaceae bacterium]
MPTPTPRKPAKAQAARRLYHHGNLRGTLVEATCKLIEKKGALGFTAAPPLTDAAFGRRHDRAGGARRQQTFIHPAVPAVAHSLDHRLRSAIHQDPVQFRVALPAADPPDNPSR